MKAMRLQLDELRAREQSLQAGLQTLLKERIKEKGSYQLTEPKEGFVYFKRVFRGDGGKPTSRSLGRIDLHPHAEEIIKKKRELKTVQMAIKKLEILQRREIRMGQESRVLL